MQNNKTIPTGVRIISTVLIVFGPLLVISYGSFGLLGGSFLGILLAIPIAVVIVIWMLKFRKGSDLARKFLIILLCLFAVYFSGIITTFSHVFWVIANTASNIEIMPLFNLIIMNIKVIPFLISLLLSIYLLFDKNTKEYFKINKESNLPFTVKN